MWRRPVRERARGLNPLFKNRFHPFLSSGIIILVVLLVAGTVLVGSISAQDTPTPTPTDTPTLEPSPTPTATPTTPPTATPTEEATLTVVGLQPTTLQQGTGGTVTISGANFTNDTQVALNGGMILPVTSQSADSLVASVGADIPAGVYSVQVSDPAGGTVTAANALTIAEQTPVPQLTVTHTEPARITAGQSGNLSIIGTNFSANTTVRLVGFGFLNTNFVNSGALTAALPTNLPAGKYTIEVSDPAYGTVTAPSTLVVNAVAVTVTPTPIPGQPELVVSSFNASPSSIYPGGSTQVTFTVVNVGSRTAQGVVVSLGDTQFSPANGQSSLTLPDLASGTSYTAALSVTAPANAMEGSQNIPLVLNSRDFSGQTYKDTANVSVGVVAKATNAAQIVLDSYRVTPNSAAPGASVVVQALFKNTGTDAASQVLVQLDSTSSVLIAGSQGNAFAVGDMAAGASAPVAMPLMVSSTAKSGVQAQALTITYLQDGTAKQATASISLDVQDVVEQSPLVLLQTYSSGQTDPLQPGQQFSFQMTLQNAGTVDVSNLLVTFGTVEGSSTNTNSSSGNATTTADSSSTTTASTSFAIYGSGGTTLVGTLAAGKTVSLKQDFIVSSDLTSGIHTLPITLQYQVADGTTSQQTLNASLIVVVPPRVRVSATSALADPLTAGQDYTLKVEVANVGTSQVALTEMRTTGDNATISDGATANLDLLAAADNTTKSVTFKPTAAGTYTITVAVDYIDDLNRTQTITTTFTGKVTAAQQATQNSRTNVGSTVPQQNENILGRLLLGFLGFGG